MEKRTAMWTSSWTGEGIHSRGATGEIRVYELPLLGNGTFCPVILITHFFLPKLTTILNFFAKMLLSFYCVVTCGDAKVKELNMLLLALLRPHQFRNLLFFKRSKWNKSCRYWKKKYYRTKFGDTLTSSFAEIAKNNLHFLQLHFLFLQTIHSRPRLLGHLGGTAPGHLPRTGEIFIKPFVVVTNL